MGSCSGLVYDNLNLPFLHPDATVQFKKCSVDMIHNTMISTVFQFRYTNLLRCDLSDRQNYCTGKGSNLRVNILLIQVWLSCIRVQTMLSFWWFLVFTVDKSIKQNFYISCRGYCVHFFFFNFSNTHKKTNPHLRLDMLHFRQLRWIYWFLTQVNCLVAV